MNRIGDIDLNVNKVILVIFVLITVAILAFFSYTLYLWIGITGALRQLEENVEIVGVQVNDNLDGTVQISVNISIYNPSEFSFRLSYIAIKEIWVGKLNIPLYSGSHQFPDTFKGLNLGLEPFSEEKISFNFTLDKNVSLESGDWIFLIRLHLNTVFNYENPLRVDVVCNY